MSRHADLAFALALAIVAAVVAQFLPGLGPIRAALVVPLVFILPGYALTASLFPRPLGWAEWLLNSGGLSLALTVLTAICLNLTPWGLNSASWLVVFLTITVGALAIAAVRRSRLEPRIAESTAVLAQLGRSRLSELGNAGLLVAAVVVAGGALWLARTPVPEQPTQGFTLLWSLPSGQSPGSVRVGVQSFEPIDTEYELRIAAGGQPLQDYTVSLQPTQGWQADVTVPPGVSGDVEAVLYRADNPDVVYRRTLVRGGA